MTIRMNPFRPDLTLRDGILDPTRRFSWIYCPIIGVVCLIFVVAIFAVSTSHLLNPHPGFPRWLSLFGFAGAYFGFYRPAKMLLRCGRVSLSPQSVLVTHLWRQPDVIPISTVEIVGAKNCFISIRSHASSSRATPIHVFYSRPGYDFMDSVSQFERFLEHVAKRHDSV